jgi:hypothetical protein
MVKTAKVNVWKRTAITLSVIYFLFQSGAYLCIQRDGKWTQTLGVETLYLISSFLFVDRFTRKGKG